ncbi:MAG: DUF4388 domain-containing protein [Calditrichaeota bacterium]|nr:MAG: DUF4388 domain-containing protein [Calditrichota bacterium]
MALIGNLKDLKLTNIIQINCIERNRARVVVSNGDARGTIYFANGNIVHAEFGPFIGERAVHEMLALTEGQFKVEAGVEPPAQTINQPWNSVVLEGLRLIDEKQILPSPIPRQLFSILMDLQYVKNVFVLNSQGKVIEGRATEAFHPAFFNYLAYKVRKMINLMYADAYQYILVRRRQSYLFVFDFRPNLLIIETDRRVFLPEFTVMVKKLLKQLDGHSTYRE